MTNPIYEENTQTLATLADPAFKAATETAATSLQVENISGQNGSAYHLKQMQKVFAQGWLPNTSPIKQEAQSGCPGDFAQAMSGGKWLLHKHLQHINDIITPAILAGNKKIIINMPPRHGKSNFLTEWLPLWYLTQFPEKQIMLATYNQQFATFWGRKVKDLIKQHGPDLGLEIRKDNAAADNFKLNTGGGMITIGAGGSLTGRGADLLLIDDPIKNDAEASSLTYRNALWNWFNSTAFTRIEPGGTLILTMTRWHEDDLCGRLLLKQAKNITTIKKSNLKNANINAQNNDTKLLNKQNNSKKEQNNNDWILIKLPAFAEEDDPLGRKKGTPLWNKRFNYKKLNEIKTQIGDYWFAALYQQSPAMATGAIFKRNAFRYFYYDKASQCYVLNDNRRLAPTKGADSAAALQKTPALNNECPEAASQNKNIVSKWDCPVFAVVDLAATTKQTSDYTVILVFAITKNNQILVLDVIREKFEGSEHLDLLKEIYRLWNPVMIGIESVQYQISLVQMARKQNLPIKELRPDKDKVARSLPINSMLEAEKVFFHSDGAWLAEFENELVAFPKGKHDDQVDAFAYITYMLAPILGANSKYSFLARRGLL